MQSSCIQVHVYLWETSSLIGVQSTISFAVFFQIWIETDISHCGPKISIKTVRIRTKNKKRRINTHSGHIIIVLAILVGDLSFQVHMSHL
jgi:hypothetical protein